MNSDEFEKRLQRQTFREVPANWRQEILSAANAESVSDSSARDPQPISWWREMLWPCPQAWAGLAAVWLVILTMNFATREPANHITRTTPTSPEAVAVLKEQRRLFLELAELHPNETSEPQKPIEPRPRSDRRKEFAIV